MLVWTAEMDENDTFENVHATSSGQVTRNDKMFVARDYRLIVAP